MPNTNVLNRCGENLLKQLEDLGVPTEKLLSRTSLIGKQDNDMGVPPWKLGKKQIDEFLKEFIPTKNMLPQQKDKIHL